MDLKKLGRFQIIEEVGSGGMGVVYKGLDPKINRPVALKVIRTLLSSRKTDQQQQALERFYIEAQAAGQLSHQNIVTIYDVGEESTSEGKIVYIAMEFLDGDGLDQYIATDKFSFREKVRIVRQIAEGLDYAHKREIVHRDVKPANIIITEGNVPKLTDFGLARFPDSSLTMSGTILGTPNYMAPEQVQGKKVDARSDFFALSVIFYEMLTTKKPFAGETITTVIYRVVNDDPIPPSRLNQGLPASIDSMIAKALSKSPSERFQSGKEYIKALDDLLASYNSGAMKKPVARKSHKGGDTTSDHLVGSGFLSGKSFVTAAAGMFIAIAAVLYFFLGTGAERDKTNVADIGARSGDIDTAMTEPSEPEKTGLAETSPPESESVADEVAPLADQAKPEPGATKAVEPKPAKAVKSTADKGKQKPAAPKPEPKKPATSKKVVVIKPKPVEPVKVVSAKPPASVGSGYLTVKSKPQNAEVFIGDKFLGLTPINNLKIKRGKHNLRLAKSGYMPYNKTIELGEKGEFTISLIKTDKEKGDEKHEPSPVASKTGTLEILAPPNSMIVVDGRQYSGGKIKLDNLSPGSHMVYIQSKGRTPINKRISVVPGKVIRIDSR